MPEPLLKFILKLKNTFFGANYETEKKQCDLFIYFFPVTQLVPKKKLFKSMKRNCRSTSDINLILNFVSILGNVNIHSYTKLELHSTDFK